MIFIFGETALIALPAVIAGIGVCVDAKSMSRRLITRKSSLEPHEPA